MRLVVDAADVAAQSVQVGTVESRASPLTGQKEARASRRCEAEFWQIDPLAMTDPLTAKDCTGERPACLPRTYGAVSDPPPSSRPIVVWFRQDFRIRDNPALYHAARAARASRSLAICWPFTPQIARKAVRMKMAFGGAAAVGPMPLS